MDDFEVFENNEYYSSIEDSSFQDFFEYLKNNPKQNFIKYTENICIAKFGKGKNEHILDIPRLKWMILLNIIPVDFFSLSIHDCYNKIYELLNTERNNYFRSFNKNKLDISKLTSMDPLKFHPLSQIDNNPWNEQHKNGELLDEIWKDVTRTYSERQLFSNLNTRQLLQRILFTWTRENPQFGYKQGMNEIAAILFLINYSQKIIDINCANSNDIEPKKNEYKGNNNLSLERIFSRDSIEADTYIMFNSIMNFFGLKYMFQSTFNECNTNDSNSLNDDSNKPPIVHKCINIYGILEKVDYDLFNHLYKEHEIEPQLIFLRWIRLLFSREFSDLNNSIIIWEYIFCDALQNRTLTGHEDLIDKSMEKGKNWSKEVCDAVESSLPIVNYIAVSILLARKKLIINSDFNHTLKSILSQSNLSISPLEILSNAKSLCYGVVEDECSKSPKLTSNLVSKDTAHKKVLLSNQRNNFFEHRDIHYSQIRYNPNCESELNLNAPKLNESLLEITKNLHISAKNINDIEQLKCNIVSSCKELLRICRILQEKNI
ncbi:TBC domain-containing protein [Cryptosporidium ubiquitum]|uniref:TBC domain-containing protein n=1 Tax=Cryptosporidium ubiquitum TaxID=857276 RepID=A0A1J4MLD6_9CRYT|nr:TBC domain-containing protein [Cryptosporidium ubiquitum]OII74267.1 TBC domain-containing protein [Cryptosporidium ubiquitum]